MASWVAALLVVVTSAAVLVLEILASRLVAPYVGLTLETYTAAIGVALAAIAAGAALGGRLADAVDPRRWLGPATAVGGALLMAARPTVLLVGDGFRGLGPLGTVVLVLFAVAPAALVLTMVTPGVVKLRLRTLAETGQTVGRLSALGTLGALAGTFLTGFVLLASFPTSTLLLLTGGALVLGGLVLAVLLPRSTAPAPPGPLVAVLVVGLLTAAWLVVLEGPCQYETRYYCASVLADPEREGGRTLVLDGLSHSYVDLDDPSYLRFAYTQRIADVLALREPGPLDALHVGGGGFSVPRFLADARPGSRSTVLELDPLLPDIAREELDLATGPDLQVRIGDARIGVRDEATASYDVVVGDAFGSLAVPWHLATRQMVEEVARVLRPGGVYALNVIDHPPLAFVRAETATLQAVFAHVAVMAPPDYLAGEDGGNFVLVASDEPLPLDELARRSAARDEDVVDGAAFAGGAQVLTDDDAPVDQLLTPYRRPR